jgi:hypothetical protein
VLVLLVLLAAPRLLHAQQQIAVTGDRLTGFVLPVEPLTGDIRLSGRRGWAWAVGDTKRIVLQGDVSIRVATQEFTAQSAAVWINRLPSADGLINQIAVYFDRVDNARRRSGVGVAGEEILVTGSARGGVRMQVDLLERNRPRGLAIVQRGQERLALHLRTLIDEPLPPLTARPQVEHPDRPDTSFVPIPGGRVRPQDLKLPTTVELPALAERPPWLRDPSAVVRVSFGTLHVEPGDEENVISITGSVVVEYTTLGVGDEFDQLTLSADRAVIFTDPGPLEEMAAWEMSADRIHGIYLEGNVNARANDDEYRLRAPHVYYDFGTGQAIMLDAVLRTYERDLRVPIFARAEEMRQIADNQWTAGRARVTTSEFHTGHFSLGAERMTVTRRPGNEKEPAGTYIDADHITMRAGNLPFFWWPSFSGRAQDIPLRGISVGSRDNDGVRIETKWDLFSLLGIDRPSGVDGELKLDGFTERGAGVGLEFEYDVSAGIGALDLYGMYDEGTDRTSSGGEVDPDRDWRGVALWEHQMSLGGDWLAQAQGSWISDETFVTTWREDDFRERREYETSIYLKDQHDRAALTVLGKYDLNDFISNDYLLASQGYSVDKLPEISYRRFGDSWFGGAVTYSGGFEYSRMRLRFEESTPAELGVPGRAFGIAPFVPVSDSLRAQGLSSQYVNRFDSRHELAMPGQIGPVEVTPFVVGRLTRWDDDFEDYSDDADDTRVFGAVGVRLHTHLQRVHNDVESRLFDLHRLRHIVEPSMTLWYGYADVDQTDLPVYDLDVESLATGSVVRMGLKNTLQTQRGGPGRWRSVDFLTVDTEVVFHSNDIDRESPTPQFFDYRPEYSQFGDHVRTAVVWQVSDAFSVTGEGTVDVDESAIARGAVGAELRHSPLLSTYVEFRYIDASDNELLGVGWQYRLTPKYQVAIAPQWDFRNDEFRSVDVQVTRAFPDFDLTIRVNRDEIKDDTSFGASIGLVEF